MRAYFVALAVTLISEVPIVAALYPGRRRQMALACALATTATHVLLHFVFPRLLPASISPLFFGETFALLSEAAVYWVVTRELGRALLASAVANSTSFSIGLAFSWFGVWRWIG